MQTPKHLGDALRASEHVWGPKKPHVDQCYCTMSAQLVRQAVLYSSPLGLHAPSSGSFTDEQLFNGCCFSFFPDHDSNSAQKTIFCSQCIPGCSLPQHVSLHCFPNTINSISQTQKKEEAGGTQSPKQNKQRNPTEVLLTSTPKLSGLYK